MILQGHCKSQASTTCSLKPQNQGLAPRIRKHFQYVSMSRGLSVHPKWIVSPRNLQIYQVSWSIFSMISTANGGSLLRFVESFVCHPGTLPVHIGQPFSAKTSHKKHLLFFLKVPKSIILAKDPKILPSKDTLKRSTCPKRIAFSTSCEVIPLK